MRGKMTVETWMVRTLFCVALVCTGTPMAQAVPATGELLSISQPDGTVVQIHLRGDEFYSWYETPEGNIVMQDVGGWWVYAVSDGAGDVQPGFQRVTPLRTEAMVLAPVRPDPQVIEQKVHAAKQALGYYDVQPAPAVPEAEAMAAGDLPPVEVEPLGTVKNLVILCYFSDHATTVNHCRPASEYDLLFNQVGHSADGAAGSVKDYFTEVSYNKLTLQSTIAAGKWLPLPQTEAFYGADGATKDLQWRQMVLDALSAADTAGVDFSQFDDDSDGWIDAIDIIHSGYGQEYIGAPTTYVWSKRGFLGNSLAVQYDGVWISGVHTEPALRNLSGTSIVRIGVICHETGHFFGLPDLYDTDGSGSGGSGAGIGGWGLMASGSWGADGGSWPQRPTHLCGWSKAQLGWIDPSPVHTATGWSLQRVEDNREAYTVREGLPDDQYFLVSNRQATGFDTNLLGGGGLEILHVDDGNLTNRDPSNLKVAFEEGDGNASLLAGTRAQAGDPWRSPAQFTGATTPNTNSNPYGGGTPSLISFTSISANANPMTFSLQTLVPTVSSPLNDADGNYSVTWTTPSGSPTAYQLDEGSTTTVTSYSDNCNSEQQFRNDWIALGGVRRVTPPSESDTVYLMQFYDSSTTTWYDSFYSFKLRRTFRVTASTTISYLASWGLYGSGKDANVGYFQIRQVGTSSWTTLTTFSGGTASWSSITETSSDLSSFVGQECEVRFLVINNVGTAWTYPNYPGNGLAVDDFGINNAQMTDYSWSTLSASATTPYSISSKPSGAYFYRARAYSGGSWQDWSNISRTNVNIPPVISCTPSSLTPSCTEGQSAASDTFDVSNSGDGTLSYSVAESVSWIASISPTGGSSTGSPNTHTVTYNSSGLTEGVYETDITVTAAGATNSPQLVHVTLTVDAAPTVDSITGPSVTDTNSGPVTYTVNFSESVTGFDGAADIQLNTTGDATGSVSAPSGSGSGPYAVTISSISGDGTLGITVKAGAATDSFGNTNAASAPSSNVNVDNMAPTASISAPSVSSTHSGPVTYTVNFSESVTGFAAADDVQLNATGSATASVAISESSGPYTVTLSDITGVGTLGITVKAGAAQDAAGNANGASAASDTVNVTNTAPVATNDEYDCVVGETLSIAAPGVCSNDSDVDGDPIVVGLVTNASQGALTLNVDGSFTYVHGGLPLDFNDYAIEPYGGQDAGGSATVEDGGVTLHLSGNTWKRIDLPYTVTVDTVLEFDFRSDAQGEIHGIGFDDDDVIRNIGTFQMYGSQLWGVLDHYDYSGTDWKHYRISVGQLYTGAMQYLFFVNDHDVASPTAESRFRNIRVYEESASDEFTYRAYDGSGYSNEALVIINVMHRPIANNDRYSCVLGSSLAVPEPGVLSNDTDTEGDALTAELVSDATQGTLTLNADGSFTYVHAGPVPLDFNDYAIEPYGGQDAGGSATVEDGGVTLHLSGNTWKRIDLPYTVTADTVLEFDFRSDAQGEIHGIGFDNDDDIRNISTFQVYGSQLWGVLDHYDYSGTDWKHYRISVGQFYTGAMQFLFFVNDHDVMSPNAESRFRNVKLHDERVTDTFTYRAHDGTHYSTEAVVFIDITPPPTAIDDVYGCAAGSSLAIPALGVLSNDTDAEGDQLVAELVNDATQGTLTLNADGSFTYIHGGTPLDFNDYAIEPYGGQDAGGSATVEDGGVTLRLSGNTWKRIDLPYTVTADTVLEFDFRSDAQGEIHGIGFDNDDVIRNIGTFQMYGSQLWGVLDHYDYSGTDWKHYRISVGQFYTGAMQYLFFVNDHDVASATAESRFRNIRVYEAVDVDSFTYRAFDGSDYSNVATVTINITP